MREEARPPARPQPKARPWVSTTKPPCRTMTFTVSPAAKAEPATCSGARTVPAGRSRAAVAPSGGKKPARPNLTSRSAIAIAGCKSSPARTGRRMVAAGAHTSKRAQPQPVQAGPINLTGKRAEPVTGPDRLTRSTRQPAGMRASQPVGTMRAPGMVSACERASLTSWGRITRPGGWAFAAKRRARGRRRFMTFNGFAPASATCRRRTGRSWS